MTITREFGAGFMPAWNRPWLRFITTPDEGGAATDSAPAEETDPAEQDPADENPAGADALGDPGKKALDAMKAKWKEAERRAREEADARAALEAKLNGQEAEHHQQIEAQRVKDEALAAANLRIKKAELRVAAKGKLSDPGDALTFIDLDAIDVDDEGNVDTAALEAAVDDLLKKKPYLAAQGGSRFQGSGDGGARNGLTKPPQLTEAEVKKLYAEGKHDEIVKLKAEGRLDDYLNS